MNMYFVNIIHVICIVFHFIWINVYLLYCACLLKYAANWKYQKYALRRIHNFKTRSSFIHIEILNLQHVQKTKFGLPAQGRSIATCKNLLDVDWNEIINKTQHTTQSKAAITLSICISILDAEKEAVECKHRWSNSKYHTYVNNKISMNISQCILADIQKKCEVFRYRHSWP